MQALEAQHEAAKFDSDIYEKVDYSLIPWELLAKSFEVRTCPGISKSVQDIHELLNHEPEPVADFDFLSDMITRLATPETVAALAVSLGYGANKYGRYNWQKGFSGDYHRLLRAALRHGVAYLQGRDYDNQQIDTYTLGNSHLGGFVCGIMFAYYELKEGQQPF